MLKLYEQPAIEEVKEEWINEKGVRLFIKREDRIHPFVSGNKWRKLKYNLLKAREDGHKTLLTFGGAFSNHIYAAAAAAKEAGFQSIGVIRGDELADKPLNETLSFAKDNGMKFHFVSREDYRIKHEELFITALKEQFGEFYLVPEGGSNHLAIRGCEEIVDDQVKRFDFIGLPVGTGGTISGIISASDKYQQVIGFSALKGDFLIDEVKNFLSSYQINRPVSLNWQIETDYHFGGYAKTTPELINFIKRFEADHNIPLDQVYTGKMMYGLYDKIRKGYFDEGVKILAIHTGGLQGRRL
ncbi:1-aminocyclopropane-1-carboxylate deaminase/D-cysteine desulfhydrase [Fulvivirga kasyanovii]|uniref:1-aminocyclopropane-1-carboxylate deaminase/D-cysteine desulfhydrase n=2 Tax=Fulvivirga kasyanovii TaxID=396812 RepID=A0ABW9RWK8_9BACT|nr:pyridoxal-phosphate dependent enzyme [Fulvivirga kasyanovii]MTI28281.1 1-aminocyclopropane-1-carboxylate deaminase/D-cysteine desulfhydrase [Fulvivirga kasyanovii]